MTEGSTGLPTDLAMDLTVALQEWRDRGKPNRETLDSLIDRLAGPEVYGWSTTLQARESVGGITEERLAAALCTLAREPHETTSEVDRYHGPDARAILAALEAESVPGEERLIDTQPGIGALTDEIELEVGMHNPVGAQYECDCGMQSTGDTFNHHVAQMVDYRLTATDGDA